jgi:abortive infection bacteriophage resistance protein
MRLKPFHSYDDQIALLESRGLNVPDHGQALEFLKHHNYYRLSAYRFSFQDAPDHFQPGTTFEDLCQLYRFDRGLRLLVGEACKSLEISVRARWAYVLGEKHGKLAYEDPSVFRQAQRHTQHLASLDREIDRSHEVFIEHYKNTYGMPRPPIWAACEVMSFGLLSRFYANIRQASTKKQISMTYGLSARGLESLLLHSSYLRNLCAHHSRLWNRSFTITVSLPTSQPAPVIPALNTAPSAERKIYNSLVLLAHVMDTVSTAPDWKARLKTNLLTLNRPDHSEMAFPTGWQNLAFWQ